ncbi:MAG: hypothetical protein WBC91_18200 [Phototrophicaceae bacterium]
MAVRQAILDDTRAICHLFIASIDRWQRMTADGQVEDVTYDDLSIYDRWLHGGAWMSVETGALWLSHLASGKGLALVHHDQKSITGYAEATISQEAAPYGKHLHINALIGTSDDIRTALLMQLIREAQKIGKISVSSALYDAPKLAFYRGFEFNNLIQVQRVHVRAQGASVGFYKVTEHHNTDANQINGWQMPLGRMESARYHWEVLWAQLWHAVPELQAHRIHRLQFNAGGQDAFIVVQEQLYNPRNAEIFCWTPKALTANLIGAIRDWTYKTGYRTLTMAVDENVAKIFDANLETTAYQTVTLVRSL